MELPKPIKSIVSIVCSGIITLASLKELLSSPAPLINGETLSYLVYVAYIGVFALPLWVAYQIGLWRSKRRVGSAARANVTQVPVKSATGIAGGRPHSSKQLEYRSKVRDDLLRIVAELYDIEGPKDIQFESWNAFVKPDPRPSDINNSSQLMAVENFSTVLNARNDYVKKMGSLFRGDFDSEFLRLNNQCILMYEKIRESGFLDDDVPTADQPELIIDPRDVEPVGEVKNLEVRFQSGEKRTRGACFYYATVRAKGQKTVKNVLASCDGNRLRIIPKNEKPSFGIDWNGYPIKDFDKGGAQAFIDAVLREERKTKDSIRFVHPGRGEKFVLFFGVEERGDFYIPAETYLWYNPRTGLCGHERDEGTGVVRMSLHLSGQDAKGCDSIFEVAFQNWKSFEVKLAKSSQQF